MADQAHLTARSPAIDLLPLSHGPLTLTEVVPEAITSLMPLAGAAFDLPEPNRSRAELGGTLLWSGRGQALLVGPAPAAIDKVAMTDQSDAWAVLRLDGAGLEGVLARLTPLDTDHRLFRDSHVARSLLGHMNALFHQRGAESCDIYVFRSMTGTAVHEIDRAIRGVVARADL